MIAVTGANGLLGSFVIRKLHETNTPYVAIKQQSSDTSLLADVPGIIWRDANILDPIELQGALTDVSGVIHTAAIVSFNPRLADRVIQVNVEGTKNVVDACLVHGIKRLLHVSSVAALGRQKNQSVIDETNQWQDNNAHSTYAESKYKAELEVFRGQEEGLSTVIVNPSAILSRGNWNKSSAKIFNYVWKENLFYIDGSINFVDVRDVVNIILELYNSNAEDERYIVNSGSTSLKEFFDQTAEKFGKRAPRYKVSKLLMRVIAFFESLRSLVSGSDPLVTKETIRLAGSQFYFDNQKVRKRLKYQFLTLNDSLSWCTDYYKKTTV